MPYSKHPDTYPEELQQMLHELSFTQERIRRTLPPISRKAAQRYRAQFYALRRAQCDLCRREGNQIAIQKYNKVTVSLEQDQKDPDKYIITVANYHGEYEEDFLAAIRDLNSSIKDTQGTKPTQGNPYEGILTPEQIEELHSTVTKVGEESLAEQEYVRQHTARYSTERPQNPYLTKEDDDDS